jgi:hypothetical protein
MERGTVPINELRYWWDRAISMTHPEHEWHDKIEAYRSQ